MSLYAVNFLWILSTTVGLLLALYGVKEAVLDLKALGQFGIVGGAKLLLARSALAAQTALSIGQACFWVPGILSLFAPMPTTPVSVGAALLIVGSWAMAFASGVSLWANRKAIEADVIRDIVRDTERDATRDEGRDEGRDPIRDAARDTARDDASAIGGAKRNEDRDEARDTARDIVRDTARDLEMGNSQNTPEVKLVAPVKVEIVSRAEELPPIKVQQVDEDGKDA